MFMLSLTSRGNLYSSESSVFGGLHLKAQEFTRMEKYHIGRVRKNHKEKIVCISSKNESFQIGDWVLISKIEPKIAEVSQ